MALTIPMDNRIAPPTLAGRVAAWLRLFAIEIRRTPALYAGVLIAAFTTWVMWEGLPVGVVRWREISESASDPIIPLSAIVAGIAAFVARRDEWLRLDDQIAQTTFGQERRDVLSVLAIIVWCLAGYLIPVLAFFSYAAVNATWGSPAWGAVALTMVSIILAVAGGWLIGTVLRNRFSALAAAGLMLAVHAVYPMTDRLRLQGYRDPEGRTYQAAVDSWYRNLFPMELLDYRDLAYMMLMGAAWTLGVAAILFSLAWWWRHRMPVAMITLAVAATLSGVAATELADQQPGHWSQRAAQVNVEPTCQPSINGTIKICVHPQNEALLDDIAEVIVPLIEPIAGIPGVPTTFVEQQPTAAAPGVVMFYTYDETDLERHVVSSVLRELMRGPSEQPVFLGQTGSAQYVVLAWLLQETGIAPDDATALHYLPPLPLVQGYEEALAAGITDPVEINRYFQSNRNHGDLGAFRNEVTSAVDRFAALPDADRRAWLETHWDALVANELTLEELP